MNLSSHSLSSHCQLQPMINIVAATGDYQAYLVLFLIAFSLEGVVVMLHPTKGKAEQKTMERAPVLLCYMYILTFNKMLGFSDLIVDCLVWLVCWSLRFYNTQTHQQWNHDLFICMKGPPINWWWDWDRPKTSYMSTDGGFSGGTDFFHSWSCRGGFARNKIRCLSKAGTWWSFSLPYTVIPWYSIASQKMFVLIFFVFLFRYRKQIFWRRYFSKISNQDTVKIFQFSFCCIQTSLLNHWKTAWSFSHLKSQVFQPNVPPVETRFWCHFSTLKSPRQNAGLKHPTKLRTTQFI